MIYIPLRLSLGRAQAVVDDNDSWVVQLCHWTLTENGYAVGFICGESQRNSVLLHRVIMKPGPDLDVDHINRDRLDCRRINMRVVTRSVNLQNSSKRRDNTSGYRGISWQRNTSKWFSYIWIDKKRINLGYHAELEGAIAAREAAELEYSRTELYRSLRARCE